MSNEENIKKRIACTPQHSTNYFWHFDEYSFRVLKINICVIHFTWRFHYIININFKSFSQILTITNCCWEETFIYSIYIFAHLITSFPKTSPEVELSGQTRIIPKAFDAYRQTTLKDGPSSSVNAHRLINIVFNHLLIFDNLNNKSYLNFIFINCEVEIFF